MKDTLTLQDLIIIGAGPAGMAAARCAAAEGVSVTLIDEQPTPGGQIYRNLSAASAQQRRTLGADYAAGDALVQGLADHPVTHVAGATVWEVHDSGLVTYSVAGKARRVAGRYILIASGALERPMPLPGWTLPGVMTVGAAQILMKTSGLVAQNAVLAGSGPLLYLVAAQMLAAGNPPKALVETGGAGDLLRALPHLGGALRGWGTLRKGLDLIGQINRAGIPRYRGARDLQVLGRDRATGLRFTTRRGAQELPCDTVLLHQGVVPNTQISRALRLDHRWDAAQRCFTPVTDQWGQSSHSQVFIAGDGAGIGGAEAAAQAGRLAALQILQQLGHLSARRRDDLAAAPAAALRRALEPRAFLDRLFAPGADYLCPPDPVVICRCEEVTSGDIRRYAGLGCLGPNQTKAFGRCGMAPCQGRFCGLTVTELLAEATGQSPDTVGSYRIRAPLKPVTLGEVAGLHPLNDPTKERQRDQPVAPTVQQASEEASEVAAGQAAE